MKTEKPMNNHDKQPNPSEGRGGDNKRPNVLIIMADEIRADVVLHRKYPFVKTQHLDALRREGVTFGNAFCQTPTCVPSRASFATGKYPHQFGCWNHSALFPAEERSMGHHFSDHGYHTVSFGKTHGQMPGFKSITYDMKSSMEISQQGYFTTSEKDAEGKPLSLTGHYEGPEEEYCDFVACRQFDRFIDDHDDSQPFMAFVGIYAPHPPLYPPKRYAEMYPWQDIELPVVQDDLSQKPNMQSLPRERWSCRDEEEQKRVLATVLGMTTLVDDAVGRLLESLKRSGKLEDTIVLFTSDHGDQMGEHGLLGKFYNLYEGSLKVPLIWRLPDAKVSDVERDHLVELTDVYPSLCELCGVPRPEAPHELAGESLVSVMESAEVSHRDRVYSMVEKGYMVRTSRYKLVHYSNDHHELYDLKEDPLEIQNRYGEPELAQVQHELSASIITHLIDHRRSIFQKGQNPFFG